LLFVMCFLYYF